MKADSASGNPSGRNRPCPKSKFHKATGQVYVEFRQGGTRRRIYLGAESKGEWVAAYEQFVKSWPEPLFATPAPRPTAPRLVTHNGRTQCLTDWAREVGLKPGTLRHRLDVEKWPTEQALTTPVRVLGECPKMQRDSRNGRAFIRWRQGGKVMYLNLGAWGTNEAEALYQRAVREWEARKKRLAQLRRS